MNKNKDYDKEHKMAVTKSTAPFSTCNGDF